MPENRIAPQIKHRMVHLDALRALLAVLVVGGHVRAFLLVDYGDASSDGIIVKAVYALTSLGHEAVLGFFALSGFLVGGSAIKRMLSGSWSVPEYVITRMSRLWTVVIPALCVTWCIDRAGMLWAGSAGYNGDHWSALSSGPRPGYPVALDIGTFVANVLFLQTITAPVYGTNGPLWSLSNEFWYYLLFPAVFWAALAHTTVWRRLLALGIATSVAMFLPWALVRSGVIWLAGAVAHSLSRIPALTRVTRHPASAPATLVVLCATLLISKTSESTSSVELILGLSWALTLPTLAAKSAPAGALGRVYSATATLTSEISFTLYATHFPLLAALWWSTLAARQYSPGIVALSTACALLASTLALAAVMWWVFERNTPFISHVLLAWWRRQPVHLSSKKFLE